MIIGKKDVVLVYHSIGGRKNNGYFGPVGKKEFEKTMIYLKKNFSIVKLCDIAKESDKKKAAITFDDGLKSIYSQAFPILDNLSIPATFFVNPNFIGDAAKNKIKRRHGIEREGRIMAEKDELMEILENPLMEVGNHTLTHKDLSDMYEINEIHRQILYSKRKLENDLDTRVKHFCYPGGRTNELSKGIAEGSHETTVTTDSYMVKHSRRFDIPRIGGHIGLNKIKLFTNNYFDEFRRRYKIARMKIGKTRRRWGITIS